jgi:hypothetical protein
MGVCSAVRELALAIDTTFGGDDPRVRSDAQVVGSFPTWRQRFVDSVDYRSVVTFVK